MVIILGTRPRAFTEGSASITVCLENRPKKKYFQTRDDKSQRHRFGRRSCQVQNNADHSLFTDGLNISGHFNYPKFLLRFHASLSPRAWDFRFLYLPFRSPLLGSVDYQIIRDCHFPDKRERAFRKSRKTRVTPQRKEFGGNIQKCPIRASFPKSDS